jgi:hypothetical protein
MSTLSTRLDALRDRIQDALAGMTPRDRTLLLSLIIVAAVTLMAGSAWWMRGTLHDLESRVESRSDSLHLLKVMASEHEVAIGQSEEIKAKLKEHAGTDMSSFLEQAAKNSGVADRLNQVREKSVTTTGVLEEKLYAVALSKLTTDELSNFLFEVETSGYPLQVQTFKVKSRVRKEEKTMNLDMDIAAYRVIEEEPEGVEEGG